MSFAIVAAVTTAVVAGYSAYTSKKQADAAIDAQREANAQAQADADAQLKAYEQQSAAQAADYAAQAKAADQKFNAANQKRPDTRSLLDAASSAGRGGVSGTMLTGPAGVKKEDMVLGKSTLLGM
jgi:membrane protein involved in colicin uptake